MIASPAATWRRSLRRRIDATTMIALIETRRGVENADAIAAVDGVDCLYLGQVDLSVDLGIPGQFDDPRLLEATHALAEACRKHGKHFIWDMGAPGKLEDMVQARRQCHHVRRRHDHAARCRRGGNCRCARARYSTGRDLLQKKRSALPRSLRSSLMLRSIRRRSR